MGHFPWNLSISDLVGTPSLPTEKNSSVTALVDIGVHFGPFCRVLGATNRFFFNFFKRGFFFLFGEGVRLHSLAGRFLSGEGVGVYSDPDAAGVCC